MFLTPQLSDAENLTDEEVLAKALVTPAYFEILVGRYEQKLLSKAHHILTNNEEAAKDVVQDTLVKVYLYGPKFRVQEGASFKSWIYKILVNTCFTHYQKIKKDRDATMRIDDETMQFVDESMKGNFERKLDIDLVSSLVARLPLMLRRVSTYYFIDGLDYDQIAEKEGVTEGVVRTRIHRARKQIEKFNSSPI